MSAERERALRDAQGQVEQLVQGYLTANDLTAIAAGVSGDFDQWVRGQIDGEVDDNDSQRIVAEEYAATNPTTCYCRDGEIETASSHWPTCPKYRKKPAGETT